VRSHYFFIGKDTVNALRVYVKHMKNLGYEFDQFGPLFVDDHNNGKSNAINKVFVPLHRKSMNLLVRNNAMRAGIMGSVIPRTSNGRKKYPVRHHCFRKFWQTAMEQGGVAKSWCNYMMGNSPGKYEKVYSRPSLHQLRDAYRKAEKYMSVSQLSSAGLDRMRKDLLLSVFRQHFLILGQDPDRIRLEKEKELGVTLTQDDEIEVLQMHLMAQGGLREANLERYEHMFIEEEDLVKFLDEGWDLYNELSDGRYIIKKRYQPAIYN